MKKQDFPVFPHISFIISVLIMGTMLWQGFTMLHDAQLLSERNASGHEYLPLYFAAMILLIHAIIGAIFSCFCSVKATITWVKVVSYLMFVMFVFASVIVLLLFSIF